MRAAASRASESATAARSSATAAGSPGTLSASASASPSAGTPISPWIFFSAASTCTVSNPDSNSSARTPAQPILSSLSRVMKKALCAPSGTPHSDVSAARNRRSDSRTVVPVSPIAASASVVASISSASASTEGSPIMSMSHW